jgi:hypothetical protein
MRDESRSTAERMDAAKAAAPYVHPRLAATTVAGDAAAPITYVFRWMDETDDEQ